MTPAGRRLIERPGDRRRFAAALRREFTGEVPFFECFVADDLVDQVMGRPLGVPSLRLAPDDYVEFLQRTGMDAAYLHVGWFLGRKNRVDERGRVHYMDGTIKTRSDFTQIVPPSLDPVQRRIEEFLEAAAGTDLGVAYAVDTSVGIMSTAIGPTDSLLLLADDPSFIEEFCDRVEEYTIPLLECVLQYPLDNIWLVGPMCANAGPIISPAMHEEFIFPRLEKLMHIIRPTGVPVTLHSDGDNSAFMDWIVEAGFAALHPIEPGIGNFDIYRLKRDFGDRICLCGNIDVGSVLFRGSPEEVRRDVIVHIERLAPGGGYICGSSHDITESIPFENFRALAQTVCALTVADDGGIQCHLSESC